MHTGVPTLAHLLELPPVITLSLVVSLDGQLCGTDGSSRGISAREDLDWLRLLRASVDAVVVGRSTAETERYRAIVTRPEYVEQRLAYGMEQDPRLIIVTRADNLADTLMHAGDRVLLEAGVRLHRAAARYVERVWISHSPTIVGDIGAALAMDLAEFERAECWSGAQFARTRFERVNPR